MTSTVDAWLAELEARQLADLTFSEVSRSLRALSSTYVERRGRLREGAALAGAGKRAAFALYYGPLHFLLIEHIVRSLGNPFLSVHTVLDLGCGTGSSGAAWAAACLQAPSMIGIDRNPWAIQEARRTYDAFGLRAAFKVGNLQAALDPRTDGGRTGRHESTGILLAFAVNEVATEASQRTLLDALMRRIDAGAHVIIVEPLARAVAPWWNAWARVFVERGGRADEWRFRPEVPAIVEKLGRAAGLDYREVRGRTLSL